MATYLSFLYADYNLFRRFTMLSRLSAPFFRNQCSLPKTLNTILPATYTTLHGTNNRNDRHSFTTLPDRHPHSQRHRFTPVTGVTQHDTSLLNHRLLHGTPRNESRFDWRKYTRDIEVPDWVKKASPQAITEEASRDVQPYLRLMRFDRPIGKTLFTSSECEESEFAFKMPFITNFMRNWCEY